MTPNEITTLLASHLHKELDVPFKKMMMERVKYWRSRMIRQTLEKNDKERKFFRQSLFINMERSDRFPCGTNQHCYVSTNTTLLPIPVRANNILFDYVGGLDGASPFKYVEPGQIRYLLSGRFGHLFPIYEYVVTKLTVNVSDIRKILIEGIFDDPEEVFPYTCVEQNPGDCDYWNSEFPMSGEIMQLVIQSIVQVDYGRPAVPEDKEIPVDGPPK